MGLHFAGGIGQIAIADDVVAVEDRSGFVT
jgi:hypothetical protein